MSDDLYNEQPERFEDLSEDQKRKLLSWIDENLRPGKSINPKHTSYGLKRYYCHDEEYTYDGAFKGAMLAAGYTIQNRAAQHWCFNVAQSSPLFHRKARQ